MNDKTIVSGKAAHAPAESRNQFAVSDWKDVRKGESLQAYLTLRLQSGMRLYECTYHERADGSRWVGLPARSYTKPGESKRSWFRLVDFDSRESHQQFQSAALEAIARFLEERQP